VGPELVGPNTPNKAPKVRKVSWDDMPLAVNSGSEQCDANRLAIAPALEVSRALADSAGGRTLLMLCLVSNHSHVSC
jgi:hypothetical protein